ncbi:unnamed protein product [Phytophthora fragariaefolia]|uniref:Unnamed protein product n=1 Tax=Phytophthora fragariaefolia TaxID=1490495 RepID=A0A9W6YMZ5_9STRA|nr:unnamed protein product [Phytophthora fragariaefolia]
MVLVAGEAASAATATASSQAGEESGSRESPRPSQGGRAVQRTPRSTPSPTTRVSPYPLHVRTAPQLLSSSVPTTRRQARVSLDASPVNAAHDEHRLQLLVQPLVKDTVGSRDTLATMPKVFAANGATFSDIMHKLWEQFSCRVRGLTVKQDDTWSITDPIEAAWYKAMQFKWNSHLVPTTKSEAAWNRWLAAR